MLAANVRDPPICALEEDDDERRVVLPEFALFKHINSGLYYLKSNNVTIKWMEDVIAHCVQGRVDDQVGFVQTTAFYENEKRLKLMNEHVENLNQQILARESVIRLQSQEMIDKETHFEEKTARIERNYQEMASKTQKEFQIRISELKKAMAFGSQTVIKLKEENESLQNIAS